jgi:hypothetical protein
MTTARQGFIASLREQVSANLSPGLQPAANTLIDGIELDLEVISAVLFFDLGVVIGFGEGLAGMIAGLFRIAWALLEFVVDYFVAIVLHDLEPLAEDLDALALAWHDLLSIDMMGILEGWLIRFEAAPIEGRAEMVGEFVGEVLAFIATWETSTSRLSKFLPPPGAAPQLAAAVAGGGSMAVPLTEKAVQAIDILGPPIVGLGPPASLQIMNMSGKGDEPESKAGAATPPAAGPTRTATELAPGPIDPVLLPLLEGVGLVARPPSAALLRAREALRLGTATTADYEVLLQEAVNDARDFIRTSSLLSRQPRIEPAASWKVMQGSCGRGRDASAASRQAWPPKACRRCASIASRPFACSARNRTPTRSAS